MEIVNIDTIPAIVQKHNVYFEFYLFIKYVNKWNVTSHFPVTVSKKLGHLALSNLNILFNSQPNLEDVFNDYLDR